MSYEKAWIPWRGYWSSPFCRWQGSFANEHAIKLAANTAKTFLDARGISADVFDDLYLGQTVPQPNCFYGGPWLAALIGNDKITGPVVGQACITGVVTVQMAARELERGQDQTSLIVAADRCSNGPHLYYPSQTAPGATGKSENWVMDNFGHDPWAKNSMIETAEKVAREYDIARAPQDEVAVRRYEQYQDALADDRAFQRRYMVGVEIGRGKRARVVDADEGITPTTVEGLAKLRPVLPEGTVTFGSQTHPADGNAGIIVTTRDKARELASGQGPEVRFAGFGTARQKKGLMAAAMAPGASAALADAGITVADLKAVKTHNPFALNDVLLTRELSLDPGIVNNFGSPLVFGHPQGPTATRVLIELIEEVELRGGGYGLFSGCAAGDTAAAVVIEVR